MQAQALGEKIRRITSDTSRTIADLECVDLHSLHTYLAIELIPLCICAQGRVSTKQGLCYRYADASCTKHQQSVRHLRQCCRALGLRASDVLSVQSCAPENVAYR
jgi:hypothetical protein